MKATEYDEKPNNVKSSLLLHCIGERAREVTADSIFEAHFNPKTNNTYSRFPIRFFTYRQKTVF